jgi:hypothetical protein
MGLLQSAKVVIDGSGDRQFKQELAAYFRRQLPRGQIEQISFHRSEADRLVQLADMCAGAIARSYRKDRDDANRWRGILAPKSRMSGRSSKGCAPPGYPLGKT